MKRALVAIAFTLGIYAASSSAAIAGVYDLSYTSAGTTTTATLTTADTLNALGGYSITGITGTYGSATIAGIISPSGAVGQSPPFGGYGIHTFDWVARAKPAAIEAKRAHPARMVFGPGGL